MIVFPIIQLLTFFSCVLLFLSFLVMGIVYVMRSFESAPMRTLNPYSAKGLEDTNARAVNMMKQDKTPLGLKMDWALKRLTFAGFLMVFSFGVEWILVETMPFERSGLLR